jgi:hypothetical protein
MPDGGAALGFTQEYKMTLVGTGSLGGVDPDRIILKKVWTVELSINRFHSFGDFTVRSVGFLTVYICMYPGDPHGASYQS